MTQSLPVRLTPGERQSLLDLTRSGKHDSRVVTRAQILLYADKNGPHRKKQAEIGALLESSVARVSRTVLSKAAPIGPARLSSLQSRGYARRLI